MTSSTRVEEQRVLECHGEGISYNSEARGAHVEVHDHNMDLDKKDTTECALTSSLVADGIEKAVQDEATHGYHNLESEERERPHMQPQPTSETESENSASIEDDVKVCDICGDAGQEELLAICSRCSDGAEHTYCMQIMLDKLPEGDWLCEECKLKEEAKNQNKSEKVSGGSEMPCSYEHRGSVGNTFDPKLLTKLVTKAMDQEARWVSKELISPQISDKRNASNSEVSSMTSRKASETSGWSRETFIPEKQAGFSRECSSSNLDMGKIKQSTLAASFGGHSASSSQPLARSQDSSVSSSSNKKAELQSSRGPLSKSVSFNNSSMKPKVKQLTGIVPSMQKKVRKTAAGNTRKEELVRKMTKSASLKGMSSGYDNVETISKMQSVLRKAVDTRGVAQVKERNVMEKKSSSKIDHPFVCPTPTSIPLPKTDLEVAHMSVSLGVNGGSDDANNLVEKQSTYLTKSFRRPSSKEICNPEHRKPCQLAPNNDLCANSTGVDRSGSVADATSQQSTHQAFESVHLDDKNKAPVFFSSSKQAVSGGSRILRCQACNETGHSAEYCSIDKFQKSSLKPSADWNLKEVTGKINKSNDAAEAAVPGTSTQKSKSLASQSEQLLMSSTDQLNVKPSTQIFPDQASVLANPLRASAIPDLEFLWQGGFEVLKTGKYPELCDGIQAHLSTCASTKVLEVATKFPCIIQVNEVPRLSSWPLKFQRNGPKEDNIALFFFAKDTESYEKSYRNLLENMLRNDLALKGSIDGVELLIFPSNVLPENSQCWNRLFFLWGVFRGQANFVEALPVSQENPGVSTLNMEPLPAPLISELSTSPEMISTGNHDTELSMCDESSKAKTVKSIMCMNSQPISSSRIEDQSCHRQESHQSQTAVDNKLSSEHTKCSFPNNCGSDSEGGGKDVAHVHASTCSNSKQVAEASRSEEEPSSMESEAVLDNTDLEEDLMEIDMLSWKSRPERRHDETNLSESSTSAGKQHLFPLDLGLGAKDEKPDDLIYVLSSDDEDSPEPNAPNLELGLGSEKKSPEQGIQKKLPGPSTDDKDDSSASLSLSLAFPATNKGRTLKSE